MIFDSKLLKQAQEASDEGLVTQYKAGNKAALNELISRHQDLLKMKSNAFSKVPVPMPAIYGHSMQLLAIAANNFDPASGVRFRTFLETNLRGLNRYTHKNKNVLSFPQHKLMAITKFKEVQELLSQQYNQAPTDWQLADALGWSIPDVKEMKSKLAQKELAASGLENAVGKEQEDDALRSRH